VQICCVVLAPSFLATGIYLTLKHATIQSGREYSKVKPELYPWIFVGCDGLSILIRALVEEWPLLLTQAGTEHWRIPETT
jgi:hypothetical protein